MKCKNCGKETKILVDDGIGSHYEEDDTCLRCRGWMVVDSTSLINIMLDGNPPKRIRRVCLGEDTAADFVKQSREFEEYMRNLIDSMSFDEWLETYRSEAKKRGF